MSPKELENFFSHGSPDPLPARVSLRAGPLSMVFESGDLRYIKLGDHEVLRRIYAAVRDRIWGTIPGTIANLNQKIGRDHFQIKYTCEHRQNDIHFVWNAEILGEANGSIHFTFDGEAKSTFLRNRIGFCVLHPIDCAGAKCRAIYADGKEKEAIFPQIIAAAQPVTSLHDLSGLAHEIETSVWAELRFEGDLFETEDQRNWIDASFKTFCTPLRLPYPAEIKAGTRIRQAIRLNPLGANKLTTAPVEVEVTRPILISTIPSDASVSSPRPLQAARPLPPIGLARATHRQDLSATEIQRLTVLNPAHLRVDVRASDPASSVDLTIAAADSEHLGTDIELAVHLDDLSEWASAEAYLSALTSQLGTASCPLARILVFGSAQDDSTPAAALAAARSMLGGFGVPIGAGTNVDLYQLNLQRPPADADFICWSMNPQVHAFDCTSIAETPEAAAQQVHSVRSYFPGKPLVVSPITLKPRFNPVATAPAKTQPPGELPPDVDPRQLSLFGAAWTLAMIKAVAEAGADSVTFYETTGWRGLMETQTGSTCLEKFPSIPGTVFPLYHVLADVGEFAGGEVLPTKTSAALAVTSLLLQKEGRRRLLLANLSRETHRICFSDIGEPRYLRTISTSNVRLAITSPETFRKSLEPLLRSDIELPPHAVATIDFPNS